MGIEPGNAGLWPDEQNRFGRMPTDLTLNHAYAILPRQDQPREKDRAGRRVRFRGGTPRGYLGRRRRLNVSDVFPGGMRGRFGSRVGNGDGAASRLEMEEAERWDDR